MNVLIGPSDNGKTSIIRALRWVADNRPSGDDFRSNWGGDTSVVLKTTDGHTISRNKSNKINSYELNNAEFVAFGQDVPEEIKKALNIDHINLQQQLDSPFLLSETSGYVATHFNKVAKLEKIDKSRNYVQSEINRITTAMKAGRKVVDEKIEQLDAFIDLSALEKALLKAEKLQTKLEETKSNINSITALVFTIEKKESSFAILEEKIKPKKANDQILKLYESLNDNKVKFVDLKKLTLSVYYKEKAIVKAEKDLPAETSINNILKNYDTLEETRQNAAQLLKLYTNIERKEKARENALKQFKELEQDFHDNFPKECPLCNSKIK
jgi:exonuclease SbcC